MGADEWALMQWFVDRGCVLSTCNTGRGEIKTEGVLGQAEFCRLISSCLRHCRVPVEWRRKHSFAHGAHVHTDCVRHCWTRFRKHCTRPCCVSPMLRLARCNPADGLPETWMRSCHRLDGLCCWWWHYPSAPPPISLSVKDVSWWALGSTTWRILDWIWLVILPRSVVLVRIRSTRIDHFKWEDDLSWWITRQYTHSRTLYSAIVRTYFDLSITFSIAILETQESFHGN